MDKNITEGLLGCFAELFAYTVLLKENCAQQQPAFSEVKSHIDSLMKSSAQQMAREGIDPRDYDEARFALCAWIDETIMNMPWMHRGEWRSALLQMRLYGATNAGEAFFVRLGQLAHDQNHVREVYYFCLSLGFAGRYCAEGDDLLIEQLKKSALRSLVGNTEGVGAYEQRHMFPDAYQRADMLRDHTANKTQRSQWSGATLWLITIPPTLLVLLFIVYSFVLNGVVEAIMARVVEG